MEEVQLKYKEEELRLLEGFRRLDDNFMTIVLIGTLRQQSFC